MAATIMLNCGCLAFSTACVYYGSKWHLISQIVKQLQTFSEIEDGGVRHFEFWQLGIFNVIDTFLMKVPMFPLSLVKISQIVKKWQQLLEIRDGDGRLLELWLRRYLDFAYVF